MLAYALEEWAVICDALATGRQSMLIRSVDGPDGPFELRNTRFWLKPTFGIEQTNGIKKEALPAASRLLRLRPASGKVKLSHFAEVNGVYEVHRVFGALLLDDFHIWTEDLIRSRFQESRRGLYVMLTRIYRGRAPITLQAADLPPAINGWVHLPRGLSTEGATPVLGSKKFERTVSSLEAILNPTARA
jgi:hypothetical protein